VLLADLVDQGIVNNPHRVPWFDDLAPGYRDDQGRWYAGGLFVQVMAVNTAMVPESDYPQSWLDALEPRWRGEIGMPSIDAGGSAFALHTFLRQQIAPDYWERLDQQEPRIYPAVAPAGTDLVRGEFSLGLMGASTVVANIAQGAPLRVIFPREGIAAFPISGGITTSARRPASAAIWLNWITSARAAGVLAQAGVYGVHPSGPVPVLADGRDYPPVSQVWTIDPANWSQVRESYSVEWRAVFE
jgi:iron(III) transport system substrate-binding protein